MEILGGGCGRKISQGEESHAYGSPPLRIDPYTYPHMGVLTGLHPLTINSNMHSRDTCTLMHFCQWIKSRTVIIMSSG